MAFKFGKWDLTVDFVSVGSGLGGLTVVRQIRRLCPQEDVLYLGDTARVPYGTRSAQTVLRYSRACARALTQVRIQRTQNG